MSGGLRQNPHFPRDELNFLGCILRSLPALTRSESTERGMSESSSEKQRDGCCGNRTEVSVIACQVIVR